MSTPIEIVRDYLAWRTSETYRPSVYHTTETSAALASILRDAERFQALERAHKVSAIDGGIQVRVWHAENNLFIATNPGTLAELADKLREGK